MNEQRLYRDLAWLFPLITPLENYAEETEELWNLIRNHSQRQIKTLLHLGCGAGHNDFTFKKRARVTGVDRSAAMLKRAQRLNPEVRYAAGDFRTVRLGERFDAVVAIDSFPYLLSEKDLDAAFATARCHLRPGGVFLFIIEETVETFRNNATTHFTNRSGRLEATFIENRFDPDPADTSYEALFLTLLRRDGRLTVLRDLHRCGLFPRKTLLARLRQAGFSARCLDFKPPRAALEGFADEGLGTFPLFLCRAKGKQ